MKKYSKLKSIDYCCKNGLKFISLFKSLFATTNKNKQREILNKMQIIFDNISDIYITKTKNIIYHSQKMDWFYTATSSYDELIDDDEIKDRYDKFVLLIETNKDAQLSFAQISNQPYNIDFQKYKNILILDLLTTGINPQIDKIIKFDYVLLNQKLDIILCGDFYIKQDKLQISEKFKTKYNISLKGIQCGQDENFIFDLIQQLIVSRPLLVSFKVSIIKKFLYEFLKYYGEDKSIDSLDTLDLLSVYNENNKNKKVYNVDGAIKYYNINYGLYKNRAMIYYLLLKEMIKMNDINLYIKPCKNNVVFTKKD